MNTTPPSEHDIHAYVDGHLDGRRRGEVERYLSRHPEQADEVQGWRHDAQQLRTLLAGDLGTAPSHDVALDPTVVRLRRHQRRVSRAALAAGLVWAILCIVMPKKPWKDEVGEGIAYCDD